MPRRAPLRLPALALLCCTLAAVLATAAPARAAGWRAGPEFAATPISTLLALGSAADTGSTAVWFDVIDPDGAADFHLRAQRARPDGSTDPVIALSDDAINPVAASAPDGTVAVVWAAPDDTAPDGGRVHRALIAPDGTVRRASSTSLLPLLLGRSLSAAVDAAGNVTLATALAPDSPLDPSPVQMARIAADGSVSGPTPIGALLAGDDTGIRQGPVVTAAPDGTAWAAWVDQDGNVAVARRTGTGPTATAAVPTGDQQPRLLDVAAAAGGAALTWVDPTLDDLGDPTGVDTVHGVRLAPSGAVIGLPFTIGPEPMGLTPLSGYDVALGPDGVVTVVTQQLGATVFESVLRLSRFAPGAATAPATPITPAEATALMPVVSAQPDGALVTAGIRLNPLAGKVSVAARQVAPDGTLGADATAFAPSSPAGGGRAALLLQAGAGGAVLGLHGPAVGGIGLATLDTRVPAGDPGGPGTPQPQPQPPAAPPGGSPPAGTTPTPTPRTKAAAALKVTRATRKGARVTVSGTIARAATGKVTVRVTRKVGRQTLAVTQTATVRRGRWSVTLTVPKALRGNKARVTATYAGTATLRSATATRAVTVAKAKRKARRKP